jgi:hypothetical protein
MAFLSRKKEEEEDVEVEEKKPRRERKTPERFYEPKDPTRFLPIVLLVIFVFISYLSWVAFKP